MSTLVVDERQRAIQAITPGACQKVSYTGTAAQSSAFNADTRLVQLFATTDAWVKFGSNPTAVANDGSSLFLPAGVVVYYGVTGGQKLSAIRDASSGDVHVIEGARL